MSELNCGCSPQQEIHTCVVDTCLTRQQYRDFIVMAFAESDPCAAEIDTVSVDFFLDMANSEFALPDLVFLRAYQSACFSLMSCYSYQYDTVERYGESRSKGEGESSGQANKQAYVNGSSTLRDISAVTARHSDFSRASMDANATRNGCSRSGSYGQTSLTDSGEGSRIARNRKRSVLKGHNNTEAHSEQKDESVSVGASRGYDFAHSYSGTAEQHKYLFILQTTEIGKASHDTRGLNQSSVSDSTQTGHRRDWQVANTRKISVDGLRKDAIAQFQSNVTASSNDNSSSDSSNIYHAERKQRQRAEGQGFQRASQDGIARASSVASSTDSSSTEARKTNNAWRFSTIKSYKRSQKYDTLKRLYDLIDQQIQERLEDNTYNCGPMSNSPSLQPFLQNANWGNVDYTVSVLLRKFPCLGCFNII